MMHDLDDDNAPSVDIEVFEDLGRWRRDRDALESLGATHLYGDDESAESLTESQRAEILERTLTEHRLLTLTSRTASRTLSRVEGLSRSPQAARAIPRWRPLMSHGAVAAAAAGLVFMLVRPRLASEEGVGSCLEEDAQVRIYQKTGDEPSGHWKQHVVEGDAWQRQANGDVLFEGPLSSLAPLSSGDWTLDFQIGPRGACGPDLDPSCRKLPTVAFRVASAVECDETR